MEEPETQSKDFSVATKSNETVHGNDFKTISQPRRTFKRTVIIEPSIVLFFMFHVSSYSLFGQYIYYAIGEKYNLTSKLKAQGPENENVSSGACGSAGDRNSSVYRLQQQVQAEAATFTLIVDVCFSIPSLITTLFFGTVIDRLGRKPGMLIPLIGVSLKALVTILQIVLNLPLEMLILAYIFDALFGGFGAFTSACYSFLSDTIPRENIGKRITIAEVSFTVAMAIMSFVIGILIKTTGFLSPFVIILIGHGLNMVYTFFFVPETMEKEGKTGSMSLMYVMHSFKVLSKKRPGSGRKLFLVYVLTWILCSFCVFPRYNMEQLYKLNSPFCWDPIQIGTYMAVASLVGCLAQIFVAVFLLKRGGGLLWTQISMVSTVLTFIIEAFSSTDWMLMILPFTGSLMGLQVPIMRSALTKLVTAQEQGAIFSVTSATDNITYMVTSIIFSRIYVATLYVFKGTVFLVMAGMGFIAMISLGVFGFLRKKEVKKDAMEQELTFEKAEELFSVNL